MAYMTNDESRRRCTCDARCTEHPARPYRYERTSDLLASVLDDFRILSGNKIGPSGAGWQDVAGTLAVNLRVLARQIEQACAGNVIDGPTVFPSPDDCTGGDQ